MSKQNQRMGLTSEQLAFLKKHKVQLKSVFDSHDVSRKDRMRIMKDLNMRIAFNVPPCSKGGHTLKNRHGHCVQCNTAILAYQARHHSKGIVYVAGSLAGKLIKIGFSKSVGVRAESLNRTKYAGFNDWVVLYALNSENAGLIESEAQSLLHKYRFAIQYKHDGWNNSIETFHCAYSKAKEFVEKVVKEKKYVVEIEKNIQTEGYEFRNLNRL